MRNLDQNQEDKLALTNSVSTGIIAHLDRRRIKGTAGRLRFALKEI